MLNRSYGVVDGKMEVPAPLVRKWNRSILTCLVVETLQSTCFLISLLEIDSFFCYSQIHVYLAICYWIWDVSQLTRCFMLCCRVALSTVTAKQRKRVGQRLLFAFEILRRVTVTVTVTHCSLEKSPFFELTMFCAVYGSVADEDANFRKSCSRGTFLNLKCSYLHFF